MDSINPYILGDAQSIKGYREVLPSVRGTREKTKVARAMVEKIEFSSPPHQGK